MANTKRKGVYNAVPLYFRTLRAFPYSPDNEGNRGELVRPTNAKTHLRLFPQNPFPATTDILWFGLFKLLFFRSV